MVEDARLSAEPPTVGTYLPAADLAVMRQLLAVTPELLGSQAQELHLRVDETDGYVLESDRGWRAIFGHYTPTLQPPDVIPRQVQCLQWLLAQRGAQAGAGPAGAFGRGLRHLHQVRVSSEPAPQIGPAEPRRIAHNVGAVVRRRTGPGQGPRGRGRETAWSTKRSWWRLTSGRARSSCSSAKSPTMARWTSSARARMPTTGVKKGLVNNIDQTVSSIHGAIEQAERLSGLRLEAAFVGVGGDHLESLNSRGTVAVSGAHREITREDIERATEVARAVDHPVQPRGPARPAARLHRRRPGGRQGPRGHERHPPRGHHPHRPRRRHRPAEPDQVRAPGRRSSR